MNDQPLRRSQAQLALQYSVASILASAATIAEALPPVLELVCAHLDWEAGAYWALDAGSGLLRCSVFWQQPALDLELFRSISQEIAFAPGVGLPGRVWASGTPALIRDVTLDANFPRAEMATADGLRGAVCFPVTTGAGFHGAIECFSRSIGDLDEELVRALTALGAQVGQFVERARAEAARRETEMRRASMLETALDAIVTMDHSGRVVEFNPAAEHAFGYSREEALGSELADLIIPFDQRAQHRVGLARYLATGEGPLIGRRLEITALRADGSQFPAEVAITRAPVDGPPLFTGYIRDLSERHRMEAALRTSEERLRTVVANAPVVLFAVDRDGTFTLSEGAGLAALGIRPDEHVGQSYRALYRHLPDSVAAMERTLAGESVTSVERFKGLVFETHWMPERAADGTVVGVIGVSTDITERRRVEEERDALLERERASRAAAVARAAERDAVFEAMTDGVFTFDRHGVVQRANRAFAVLIGLTPQGEDDYTTLSAAERGQRLFLRDADGQPLAPDHRPVDRILHGEILTGGQLDILIRAFDGRDVLLGVSGAPLYDDTGQIVGGVCVCRDVTERRRLEQRTHAALDALLAMAEVMVQTPAASEEAPSSVQAVAHRLGELTRDLLGSRSVGIIAIADEDVLRPLACVGLPPEQTEQWGLRIANWPRSTPLFEALITRLRAGEAVLIDTTQSGNREMVNPFGIERYLLAPMRVGTALVGMLSLDYGPDFSREPGDAPLVEGVAGLAALVLERERLQQEREEARSNALALREANRRMDEFLGIAGHEMRTPLTSITANLQLAQRRMARLREHEDAQVAAAARGLLDVGRLLDRSEGQVRRIARLVDDMVDVSRIQAGRLEIRRQRCDLAGIVRDSVDEQRALAPSRRIELTGDDAAFPVDADPDRIAQVVANYLTNAIKYAPEERPILVGLAVDGVAARVWVRDEGPGLTIEEQQRVWELFYRADGIEPRHGSSVGLGMGLHICRTIVEQHGGRAGVESAPGKGATFWFALPLAP